MVGTRAYTEEELSLSRALHVLQCVSLFEKDPEEYDGVDRVDHVCHTAQARLLIDELKRRNLKIVEI